MAISKVRLLSSNGRALFVLGAIVAGVLASVGFAQNRAKPLGNNGLGVDFRHELPDGIVVEGTLGVTPIVVEADDPHRRVRRLVPPFRATRDSRPIFKGMAFLKVEADSRAAREETLVNGSTFTWGFRAAPRSQLTWADVVTHHDVEISERH